MEVPWNFDFLRGGWSKFKDGAAYNIKVRKNDAHRFGHQARIGVPKDGRFDVLAQTKEARRLLQLHQHPDCDRRTDASVRCRACPPLFPRRIKNGSEFDLSRLKGETTHPYRLQCEQWRLGEMLLARLQRAVCVCCCCWHDRWLQLAVVIVGSTTKGILFYINP